MKAFLCFAALLAAASAAKCPTMSAVANFTVNDFMGTWYQQYSINTLIFPAAGHCAKAEFTLNEDNSTFTVLNTGKSLFGQNSTVQGSAALVETDAQNGRLLVTVDIAFGKKSIELDVLATDYSNYTILWTCQDFFTIPYESALVYTREQTLSDEVEQLIEAAITEVAANGGPRVNLWEPTSQNNCA